MNPFKISSKIELNAQEATDVWNKFKSDTEKLKNIDIKVKIQGLEGITKDVINLLELVNKVNVAQSKLGKKTISSETSNSELKKQTELLNKYKDTYRTIEKLKQQKSRGVNDSSLSRINKDIDSLTNKLKTFKSSMNNFTLGKVELFEESRVNSQLVRLSKLITNIENKADKLQKSFNSIEFKSVDTSKLDNEISKILIHIEELQSKAKQDIDIDIHLNDALNELNKLEIQIKQLKELDSIKSVFNNLENGMRDALSTEYVEKLKGEIYQLESAVMQVDGSFDRLASGTKSSLSNASSDIKRINSELQTSNRFMGDFTSSFASYTLGNVIGDGIVQSIRGIKDAYIEMDQSITNIKKVANPNDINTNEKLNSIRQTAIETAKDVGQSSAEVMNAIADTLQAGVGNMKTSMEVAKQTMMFANVGELEQSTASSAINTMIKGFKIDPVTKFKKEINGTKTEVTQLSGSMDVLNYASNQYGTSAQQLVDGLQNGATVLGSYGVSLEETVGLMTSGIEVLGNGNKVGNGLKSIGINLAGIKASADDGTLSLNKTALTLKEVADVDVFADEKQTKLKSMTQILDEVYKKWDTFTDKERAGLSEAIAGKQQASVFQALMQNFETYKRMQEEIANGNHWGSMEAENSQYIDSISGKLNHLKEVWIGIGTTIVKSDFTKGLLDGAIKASEAIDKIIKSLDKMGALTPVVSGFTLSFAKLMKDMGKNEGGKLNKSNFFTSLKNDLTQTGTSMEKLKRVGQTTSTTIGNGFSNISKNVKGSLKSVASFVTQGLAIAGVTAAVQLGAKVWDEYANKLANTEKKLKGSIDEIKNNLNSNKSNLSELEDIEKRYNELIKKKEEYSNIPIENMSDEQLADMEELKKLTSEVAEMFPELVIGYDSEGSPIMLMADDMDKLKERTKEQIRLQEKLLESKRKELGDNSRKQIQEGEIGKESIEEELKRNRFLLQEKVRQAKNGQNAMLDALESGDKKAYDRVKKRYDSDIKMSEEYNKRQLELQQDYIKKELEVQQSAYDSIKSKKGFDELKDDNLANMNSFIDNMNWGSLNDKQYSTWINASQKLIELAKSGNPSLKQWNSELEKANDVYSANGDLKEYEASISSLAKVISKELNIDYDTAFEGLKGMDINLSKADQSMQDFLKTFGKTRYDLLNGDNVAEGLAEQFQGVQEIFESLANNENAFKANGTISYEMATEIANKDSLPDDVQKLVNDLKIDGITEKENKVIIDILTVLNEGKTEDTEAKIKEINDELKSLGKEPISIDTLFNVEGVEKLKETEDKLNKLRDEGKVTKETEIIVNGQDKAELYLQIIKEIEAKPEMTNKFILDNQDALSKMKTIEEVKKFLQENPEIVNKYDIQGIEKLDEAKNKKQELEKNGEAKTEVKADTSDAQEKIDEVNSKKKELEKETKLTVNNGELQGSVDDFNKLIEYSTKLKDGEYQISFKSNTADAIAQIDNLKLAVNNLSNQFQSIPSTTVNIETAQSAQNITGLKTRIRELIDLSLQVKTIRFNTETAQASQNVTGLKSNVSSYITSYCGKSFSTRFNTETALASQNVTGLRNNVSSYISSYCGKTFTTTFKVVTNKITNVSTVNKDEKQGGRSLVRPQVSHETRSINTYGLTRESNEVNQSTEQISTYGNVGISRAVRKTEPTPISVTNESVKDSLKYSVELLKELENRIKSVGNQLSILDKKMKHATGEEKIRYLKEQNELYKEQLQHQKELESAFNKQQAYYKNFLSSKGFQFTSDGNLKNYEEKLIAMEKEAERLEEIANKEKASDGQKKESENYKKNLDEIKKYLNEYIQVAYEGLPGVSDKFIDINNAIKDNINSIKEFEKEIAELKDDSKHKNENRDIWEVENKLDKNEALLKTAVGKEEIKLLGEQISLYKELKKEKQDLLKVENETREELISKLGEYGFTFRDDGSIEKYGQKIEKLKNTLTKDEFDDVYSMVEDYLDSTYKKIPDLENEIIGIGDSIRKAQNELDYAPVEDIDKEIERADEKELLGLLKKKLELLQQVADKKKEYIELLQQESNKTKEELEKSGISFNDDGSVKDYDETIKSLQESLKKLTGDSAKEIEKVLANLETYVKTTESEIPKAIEEWKDAQHQIKETGEEIKDVEDKQNKFLKDRANALRKATEDIMKVTQELLQTQMNINKKHIDIIEKSMELSSFNPKETFETLEKQISLLEKQQELQGQLNKELEKQKEYYKDRLIGFGVKFDEKGIATNVEDILDKIKNQMANASDSDELDALEEKFNDIVGVLDDYNGALENIVDSQEDLVDIQLEIEDVYKNMLETTKKIEDKITSIIEKQVEERKKLIDEELKKRLDSINKQKEAYNKQREEDKYKKTYEDKLKEISDLQAKIDTVSKDTSLAGQAKLAELLEELKNKQEEFDEMVQNKLDQEINDAFDKESDRLEENAEKEKEKLDEILEKENLQEIINEALNSGKLTNIDGTVTDLKDAILKFEDKYGDGLSVIGGLIKKDLLGQLDVSLDTMKNIEKILKQLNISDFYKINPFSLGFPEFSSNEYQIKPKLTINYNAPLVNVEGNASPDVMPKLEKTIKDVIKDAEKTITENIIKLM